MSLYPQRSVVINSRQRNFCFQLMESITESHNQSHCKVVKPNPSGYVYERISAKGTLCEMGVGRLWKAETRLVCYEIVSPCNVQRSSHKFSPTSLHKHELGKDRNNRHARVDEQSSHITAPRYTKDYRQARNAETGRTSLPSEREYQLIIDYQMFSPENTYKASIIKTEQVIPRNIYITYVYTCNDN